MHSRPYQYGRQNYSKPFLSGRRGHYYGGSPNASISAETAQFTLTDPVRLRPRGQVLQGPPNPDQTHVRGFSYETESLKCDSSETPAFLAGSTRTCMSNWRQITSDRSILTAVSGFKLSLAQFYQSNLALSGQPTCLNYRLLVWIYK